MKHNKALASKIMLAVLLITLLVVFTGCSMSDVALGLSGIGIFVSIAALLGAATQAILSVLGLAASGIVGIVALLVNLIEFIVSLF